MKKIMIATVAIAFAAIAQAAAINWTATWATNAQGENLSAGAQAYLLTTAYAIADATADLTAGSFDTSKVIASALTSYNDDYGAHINKSGIESSLEGSQEFYMVLLNGTAESATEFMIVDPVATDIKPTGSTGVIFGDLSDADSFASLYAWQPITGGSSVPEPTSALMLLVGLAGLALRRKQA